MITVTPEWLKQIDALKNVPDEQLQWWIDKSRHYIIPEGEFLFEEDAPVIGTHVVVSGKFKVFYLQNGRRVDVLEYGDKNITGHLPFSRGKAAGASGQACGPCPPRPPPPHLPSAPRRQDNC